MPARPLAEEARAALRRHPWRGNVRELENILHRAVLLAEGDEIDLAAIELPAAEGVALAANGRPAAPAAGAVAIPAAGGAPVSALVGRTVDEVERDLILETLEHTFGNRTHAAVMLGISIRALRNKLRDYAAQGLAVPPPPAGSMASAAVA